MTSALDAFRVRVRRTRLTGGCVLVAVGLSSLPASGQASEPAPNARAAARELAEEGAEAFERREFERALELFQHARNLVEAPTIALMQARTLVELGRWVSAVEHYTAAQQVAGAEANPAFRQAAEAARRELGLLKPRIPTLRIKLVGEGAERGAEVTIDGNALAPDALGEDQFLDPGSHEVVIKTPSGTSSARSINLSEGAREEVVFRLEPVVRVPVVAAPPVAAQTEASAESSNGRTTGWIALGTGAAFAGVGAVLGVMALGHKSDLDAVCTHGCPPEYSDDIDTYRIERNLSYLGFAFGLVGVSAGTYLVLRNEPDRTRTALNVSLHGVSVSSSFY